jgi:HK97 family phage prohead protease
MSILKKVFTSEIKAIDEKENTLTAYISTDVVDRMKEILDPTGIDVSNYRKNPVVLWAHNYDQPPIGKALWIKRDGNGILSKVKFASTEFAQEIFQLYKDGFLKAFSVGFIPTESEWQKYDNDIDKNDPKKPRRIFKKWELLEYSAVPVPANPEALALAIQKGILKTDSIKESIEKGWEQDEEWPEANLETTCAVCKEIVTKPEETDKEIRIPVRDCKITATITISEKEGIKALYCGESKEIATYLFEKAKGWTMEKAKAWVKDHEGKMFFVEIDKPATISTGLAEIQAENTQFNEKITAIEKENADLKYQIYQLQTTKQTFVAPGITADNLANKVVEIINGVIRKAQGKVS